MKRISFSLTSSAVTILMLAGAPLGSLAASDIPQYQAVAVTAHGFGDVKNTEIVLLSNNTFRAITSNSDGVQLWRALDRMATDWEQVSTTLLTADPTNTDVVEVVGLQRFVYVALNGTDGFEIWRWSRTTGWENVYEQHGQGTHATFLKRMSDQRIYLGVASSESGKSQIVRSRTGHDWQVYGSEGLGNSISAVNTMVQFGSAFYVATDDGKILRKPRNGEWEIVLDGVGAVTTLAAFTANPQMILAGVKGDTAVSVLKSADGTTWTTLVDNGFSDADNTRITHFSGQRAPHGMIRAFTENAVDGFQVWETARDGDLTTWTLYRDASDLGTANSATSEIVRFQGRLYGSTVNTTEGSIIYRLELEKGEA